MGRKILAVVAAMITAVAIIWVAYMISSMMAPFYPKNMEYMSRDDMAAYMMTVPISTFITVLIGYALAGFAGGFISTKMGRRWSAGMTLAVVVGILLTAGALVMSNFWPQPGWFILASVVIFVPVSLIGYKFAHG
jgi:ABC-type xylose transport system permease subunit